MSRLPERSPVDEVEELYRLVHEDDDGTLTAWDVRDLKWPHLVDPEVRMCRYWAAVEVLAEIEEQATDALDRFVRMADGPEESLRAVVEAIGAMEGEIARARRIIGDTAL